MIGAWAEASEDLLRIDTNELDDARWFTRNEVVAALVAIPPHRSAPPRTAIARTLLTCGWTA